MRILLAEESEYLRSYIEQGLHLEGYRVDLATDGEEAKWKAETQAYDSIVIDLGLPRLDGLSVISGLRKSGVTTPVLVVTAKASIEDRVNGLESGADDYLTIPFDLRELMARVKAMIRRSHSAQSEKIQVGGISIDTKERVAYKDRKELRLRPREFALLELFARNQGSLLTREDIEARVYDFATELMSNVVDSSICILRKKIDSPGGSSYIQTVHRRGYIFRDPDQ